MRILPNDVSRCQFEGCNSKYVCERWLQQGDGNTLLWYSDFESEYNKELGKCPYFMEG